MPDIDNREPIDLDSKEYEGLSRNLQGNILKGHGRDFTANLFLQFRVKGPELKAALRWLAETYVTSAYEQNDQRTQYLSNVSQPLDGERKDPLFGNLFLTCRTYKKLGLADKLDEWFEDRAEGPQTAPRSARFTTGMLAAAGDLGDELTDENAVDNLERAYVNGSIDALLLLANDCLSCLLEAVDTVRVELESRRIADEVAFEVGRVQRDEQKRAIEHFGYADGISQPLFLKSDFNKREASSIDKWNPFARLSLVLFRDPAIEHPDAFGSYYVFRKLEQNVRAFNGAEKRLACELGLKDADASRAGAMIIGRFRDGTPLALSETGDARLSDTNNFRYDGLLANLQRDVADRGDRLGLKCPFQAHIRKTNPRQSQNAIASTQPDIEDQEDDHRSRRIVRRGITYGIRTAGDLPESGVGLLFGCFQRSIMRQYAFMQKQWANTSLFRIPGPSVGAKTGLDPIIGQPPSRRKPEQHWRSEYGGSVASEPEQLDDVQLTSSHSTRFMAGDFVKFRGGEFFFAPSLPFLLE